MVDFQKDFRTCHEIEDSIARRHIQGLEFKVFEGLPDPYELSRQFTIQLSTNIMGTYLNFGRVIRLDHIGAPEGISEIDFTIDMLLDEYQGYLITEINRRFGNGNQQA